jgi:hypothetical protein
MNVDGMTISQKILSVSDQHEQMVSESKKRFSNQL